MTPRLERRSPSVVGLLRERTAAAHQRLEDSDFVLPATRERSRYAALVAAMLGFHLAVEAEFARFSEEFALRGLEMQRRYKAHLLELESTRLASPVIAPPTLSYETAPHAAGAVYVMEGSTLGGMLIARSLETHLHLTSSYYGCYGSQTAARWRETTIALDRFACSDVEREAMCCGAVRTFDALYEHLAGARLG